jgi:hypothetical protein
VWARATTRVDILRDANPTDSDGFGDETETAGPNVYTDVPFSLIERSQRAPDPTAGTLVLVTALVGRCDGRLDVRVGDRIKDRGDGKVYGVSAVNQPQNPARLLDKKLELTRA